MYIWYWWLNCLAFIYPQFVQLSHWPISNHKRVYIHVHIATRTINMLVRPFIRLIMLEESPYPALIWSLYFWDCLGIKLYDYNLIKTYHDRCLTDCEIRLLIRLNQFYLYMNLGMLLTKWEMQWIGEFRLREGNGCSIGGFLSIWYFKGTHTFSILINFE